MPPQQNTGTNRQLALTTPLASPLRWFRATPPKPRLLMPLPLLTAPRAGLTMLPKLLLLLHLPPPLRMMASQRFTTAGAVVDEVATLVVSGADTVVGAEVDLVAILVDAVAVDVVVVESSGDEVALGDHLVEASLLRRVILFPTSRLLSRLLTDQSL